MYVYTYIMCITIYMYTCCIILVFISDDKVVFTLFIHLATMFCAYYSVLMIKQYTYVHGSINNWE